MAKLLPGTQLSAKILRLSCVFAQKSRQLLGNNFVFAGLQHKRIHDQTRVPLTGSHHDRRARDCATSSTLVPASVKCAQHPR